MLSKFNNILSIKVFHCVIDPNLQLFKLKELVEKDHNKKEKKKPHSLSAEKRMRWIFDGFSWEKRETWDRNGTPLAWSCMYLNELRHLKVNSV